MARRLACVHGHEWEVTDDVTASTTGVQVLCPVCGSVVDVAAQEVAEESAADAATVQYPGAIPIAEAETDLPGPDSAFAGAQEPGSPSPGRDAIAQPNSFPTVPGYEILGELGRGGMGVVLKARQVKLDRLVALKMLPPASGEDSAFAERFGREARALARLSHPHIVTVHDFGQVEGQSYFVMEFIAGMNLRQRLRSGRLPLADVLAIMRQLCEALQYAHDEGIIHRDIKPENILLDRYGRVRIADFGLAKLTVRTTVDYTLTGPMQVMGTWNYMAPEQLDNPQAVDHRADIYALGVVFYEMLTGGVPRARFPLPSETGANAALDDVVLRALERDPERRYQRVSDFWAPLESIAAAESAGGARQLIAPGPGAQQSLVGQDAARPVSAPPDAGEPIVPARPVAGEPRPASPPKEISLPQSSEADLDAARQRVRGPAMGLICAALINCLPGTLVPAVILVAALQSSQRKSDAAIVWIQVAMVCAPFLMVGVSALIAARNLRNLQLFWLVLLAVAIVMVPLTPGAVLGLPCGLWALAVLRRADVRAAFRLDREAARMTPWTSLSPASVCESARRLARGPATGLACAAVFNLVMAIAIPAVWLASDAPFTSTPATAGMKLGMSAVLYVPALLVGAFTMIAALNLRKLELYWLVLLATVTAMLPITPGFVIGFPCGVWALAVLSRADVCAAFRYLAR